MLLHEERRTHSYVRHGTTSLFAALVIASGFVIGRCYKRHRATEFLDFLKQIAPPRPRHRHSYHVHFTPTSASWINQVERRFGFLSMQVGMISSHAEMKRSELVQTRSEKHMTK